MDFVGLAPGVRKCSVWLIAPGAGKYPVSLIAPGVAKYSVRLIVSRTVSAGGLLVIASEVVVLLFAVQIQHTKLFSSGV